MADPLTSIFNNKENHNINCNAREHTAGNEKWTYKPVCLLWCLLSWSERENLRSQSLKSHWYGFSPWRKTQTPFENDTGSGYLIKGNLSSWDWRGPQVPQALRWSMLVWPCQFRCVVKGPPIHGLTVSDWRLGGALGEWGWSLTSQLEVNGNPDSGVWDQGHIPLWHCKGWVSCGFLIVKWGQ